MYVLWWETEALAADRSTRFQTVLVEVISETNRIFSIETGEAEASSIHIDGLKKSL
jgi:hypothetical protein